MPGIAEISNWAILNTCANFQIRPTSAEAELADWNATRELCPWFVATSGHRIIGFARAARWKGRCAYDWTAEIAVYVSPDHHRRGVGRELYEALFALLRRQGYRSLLAGIALPNAASVALHEAMGMRHVGTLERVGYKMGRWIDVGYWQAGFAGSGLSPTPLRSVSECRA